MDTAKLERMSKWPVPIKKKEVLVFSDFANYYRLFIAYYSTKARPLINLTKDVPFTCWHTQQQAYAKLQAGLLPAPTLTQFNRKLEIMMETNAYKQAIVSMPHCQQM